MKIIGTTGDGFILTANKNEVYNLAGFSWERSTGAPELKNGSIVEVADMFQHIRNLEQQRAELEKTARSLRAAAILIERIPARLTPAETTEGDPAP